MKWKDFIKVVNAYTHTERERIRNSWKEFMKATLKIPSHSFLLGRFPLQFFQKILGPPLLLLEIFSLSTLQNANSSLLPSVTFKLLLGCQYSHIIVRRIHTKVIRCVKMLLLLTIKRKTKNFAKITNSIPFYCENLGTTIFKKYAPVPVSITKNFHCNLQFLF